mgnify:CR=1 FL=1
MIRSLLILSSILFTTQNLQAQLFPNLEGDALMNALIENYKPATILSSSDSKDSLYAVVENYNGEVECIYTGYSITLTPGADPSQDAFAKNINQEHVFPRSKGVDNTQAEYDMHHLFPSRVDVNQDRGSLPFGESQDNLTDKWYINSSTTTSVPSSNIDGYSEVRVNVAFEPREDRKGDIARAVFYVYTIYNDLIDQEFFEEQKATLCEWHQADPVDERELQRSNRVAQYQDDKPNPFVLDCTLAERLFCEAGLEPCDNSTVSTEDITTSNDFELTLLNNGQSNPTLILKAKQTTDFNIRIYDLLGNMIVNQQYDAHASAEKSISLADLELKKGVYFINIKSEGSRNLTSKKIIIQ